MNFSDELPQISVVFIFVNEALSVILRSVHSVVNHTPSHLLKEIILVDDNSDNVELKFNLDQYVNKRYPGLVKIVRNNKREGLIRARIQGWKAATSLIVGFFDAHVEFNTGWYTYVFAVWISQGENMLQYKQKHFYMVRYAPKVCK
nr:polypeptide N-acetylgalactosaminyltransferase 9-like [Pelodiscus sinensis]|eukprot:XP_025040081.1 polypeptide N-acetylgalactosaminyltransferase 9-like [Pelodiscus sinensis]